MKRSAWAIGVGLAVGLAATGAGLVRADEAARKPAILFCCPGENRYGYVGFDYMQALVRAGWAVDYIEGSAALTWEKATNYNVLVVFDFPLRGAAAEAASSLFAAQPPWLDTYFGVLDRFVKAGGGVFLHYCSGWGGAAPNDLLKSWGVQFPLLWLKDPGAQMLSNMNYPCAYTDRILPSPVSEGVHGFWYPFNRHYLGQETMPIFVDATWTPVALAGKSAYSEVPRYDRGEGQPPPGALIPAEPVKDPVLFAIRDLSGKGTGRVEAASAAQTGRLAAIQTWYQWSMGSGMKWLYNNEVLSKGLGGRASAYGRLLDNTYKWLAEPSLKAGVLGGATNDPNRVIEPQLRAGAIEQFHDWNYREEEVLQYRRPPTNGRIYRGLVGAQTALSGGEGSVADWAKAAAELKLDFLVFLEDLAALDSAKLDTLKAGVKQSSSDSLRLFAGYRMKANTGNYMFVFGMDPVWPEDRLLMGADKRTFNLQYQDVHGKWADGNPALDWCLTAGAGRNNTIGYYNFTRSGSGLKMCDLRVYSAAAIRTYEAGKLVEDVTTDYLLTCQSTAVPTPMSLNLVRSPAEMKQAVAANQALTYAQARTLPLVFQDALRWNNSYDGINAFLSDGPIIEAWPRNLRVMTFGAESFVSGRSLLPSPVHVTAAAGLKEIRIYDGRELFRRFVCGGATNFETTLFFPGTIQRSMVLVAEDMKGGVATSFAYRQYKEGHLCPIFCSDHVNDCGWMLLAHGPHWPMLFMTPNVPGAGFTWDGGPLPARPLLSSQFTYPAVRTDKGAYEAVPYQVPLLEFSDEGATRCRMVCDRVLAKGVPEGNPWSAFGPLEPAPLVDLWASHTYFDSYITGVEPNAYGAPGVFEGPIASLFTEQFTFKQDCTISAVRVYYAGWRTKTSLRSTTLAFGKGAQILDAWDLSDTPESPRRMRVDTGGWFALYSGQVGNSHLFVNRGSPIMVQANPFNAYWLEFYLDVDKQPVKAGESRDTELFNMTWPLDNRPMTAREVADIVTYLEQPQGIQLARGRQVPGPGGLLELAADAGAVELTIPKPAGVERTVPVRVNGLNKRWSVGLYQVEGYRTHYYSKANSGWRGLGLDFDARAYAPLYVSKAASTHVLIGHPVVADAAGHDLFIQATRINDGLDGKPPAWHVSVNNPTDQPVTAVLKRAMDVPGLTFVEERVALQPGEYRVLSKAAAVSTKP